MLDLAGNITRWRKLYLSEVFVQLKYLKEILFEGVEVS